MGDMSWSPLVPSDGVVLAATESSAKRESRTGLLVAGVFFVGLLGWAAFAPLDAGVVAQGAVSVAGNRQVVQHREGGVVAALKVADGQIVRAGDILVQISQPQLVAEERSMSGEIITLLSQRSRLQAEMTGGQMVQPPEFVGLSVDEKAIADEAMLGQAALLLARRKSLVSQHGVLGQRIQQNRAQIGAAKHQISANRRQQGLIKDELGGLKSLAGRGFVPVNRIRAVERDAAALDGNYGALNSDIAKSNEAIGEMRMQMATLEKQRLEDAAGQMREVQAKLDELRPKLSAARELIARSYVRATASGQVVGLKVHTVGGVVQPGETIMEIVPNDRVLVVQAKAPPNDAEGLKLGMQTQVKFTALHDRSLPILLGSISKVSADSLEDQRTGLSYFQVEVTVPSSELDKVRKIHGDNAIRAGLPADIVVPMRKRSALSYLLEPLTQTFWKSGREQ